MYKLHEKQGGTLLHPQTSHRPEGQSQEFTFGAISEIVAREKDFESVSVG